MGRYLDPGNSGFERYLPKRGSALPAMVIELKWNKNVKAAIEQRCTRPRRFGKTLTMSMIFTVCWIFI